MASPRLFTNSENIVQDFYFKLLSSLSPGLLPAPSFALVSAEEWVIKPIYTDTFLNTIFNSYSY